MIVSAAARDLGAREHRANSRWALVIEPDPNDLELASEVLRREGFAVMGACSANQARDLFRLRTIDLCLLDLGLHDVNGIELLVEVRQRYRMPVIVSTDRSDVETAVACLRLGADEFMVKPYPPALFAARIAALLRRSGTDRNDQSLQFDGLQIDLLAREVTLDDTHSKTGHSRWCEVFVESPEADADEECRHDGLGGDTRRGDTPPSAIHRIEAQFDSRYRKH